MKKNMGKLPSSTSSEKMFVVCIFLVIVFAGFFLSNKFLYLNGELVNTPLNTVQREQTRDVTVTKWVYSKKEKKMELQLQLINNTYDGEDDYTFWATTRTGEEIEPIIQTNSRDYYVLHLVNIPNDFKEIVVHIKVSGIDMKVYANTRDVEKVEVIEEKTEEEYTIERIKSVINTYQVKLDDIEQSILDSGVKINELEVSILEEEDKKKYQTAQEIKSTDSIIAKIKSNIKTEEDKIKVYEETKKENLEKIAKARLQLEDINKENK